MCRELSAGSQRPGSTAPTPHGRAQGVREISPHWEAELPHTEEISLPREIVHVENQHRAVANVHLKLLYSNFPMQGFLEVPRLGSKECLAAEARHRIARLFGVVGPTVLAQIDCCVLQRFLICSSSGVFR